MSVVLSEFLIPGWADGDGAPASPVDGVDLPCHYVDPELFFADTTDQLEEAKALCRTCPLQSVCLAGAISRSEPCGVWGGQIFEDGQVVAAKRSPGRPRANRADAA
jgi:WhiB family redox-sensing transcriptional regulator